MASTLIGLFGLFGFVFFLLLSLIVEAVVKRVIRSRLNIRSWHRMKFKASQFVVAFEKVFRILKIFRA